MIQKLIEAYLDMEAYGSNQIIKEYAKFPKYLPLPCHMEHGWTPFPQALESDLAIASKKGAMLVYSKRRLEAWQTASKIPAYIMGVPFVHYRRRNKIKPKKSAKGTISFPSHSTLFLKSEYSIKEYCDKLKQMPKEFHPITICLLYPDIALGRDKEYQAEGFKVVTAGPKLRGSLDFVKNFYDILKRYKYSTSNEIGTYTFYSVELGIPFFLYGEEPLVINREGSDPNIKGKSIRTSDLEYGRVAIKMFNTGPIKKILKRQQKFVDDELGISDCLSPQSMRTALTARTDNLSYWLVKTPLFWLMTLSKWIVPANIVYWLVERMARRK